MEIEPLGSGARLRIRDERDADSASLIVVKTNPLIALKALNEGREA